MADINTAAVSTTTNNTLNHQPACRGKQFSITVDNKKKEGSHEEEKISKKMAPATVIYYYPWKSKETSTIQLQLSVEINWQTKQIKK
jgi:hypothetical protein